jgi:hypothetical protein
MRRASLVFLRAARAALRSWPGSEPHQQTGRLRNEKPSLVHKWASQNNGSIVLPETSILSTWLGYLQRSTSMRFLASTAKPAPSKSKTRTVAWHERTDQRTAPEKPAGNISSCSTSPTAAWQTLQRVNSTTNLATNRCAKTSAPRLHGMPATQAATTRRRAPGRTAGKARQHEPPTAHHPAPRPLSAGLTTWSPPAPPPAPLSAG